MGVKFDRWTFLKLLELILVVVCLIFKRITDDEASRLFLYLQKLSREWSLLNNVTWSRVGAAVADATYGGYVIITAALFIGRLCGELPSRRRITEFVLLGVGAVLFIILGSLEFAALDSVPPDLVDNAAVIGTLSLVTGALFLLDMGGPKAKKPQPPNGSQEQRSKKQTSKPVDSRSISQQVLDIEKEIERSEKMHLEAIEDKLKAKRVKHQQENGHKNGYTVKDEVDTGGKRSYSRMSDDFGRRFGIYGKDMEELENSDNEDIPPKMEKHDPVWSRIRNGHYGKYDVVSPAFMYPREQPEKHEERPPSGPGEPGYVQYTAQHWGEPGQKTPRHSPTNV